MRVFRESSLCQVEDAGLLEQRDDFCLCDCRVLSETLCPSALIADVCLPLVLVEQLSQSIQKEEPSNLTQVKVEFFSPAVV